MQDFTEYTNLDECIAYLCDYMVKNGPFDGLLGFSQVGNYFFSQKNRIQLFEAPVAVATQDLLCVEYIVVLLCFMFIY